MNTDREIRFRAWVGSEKRMERDMFYINQWDGKCHYTQPYHYEHEDKVTVYDCGEEEPILMQFSGRHDKDKREIYECDVFGFPRVGFDDEVLGYVRYDPDVAAFVVVKENGGWSFLAIFLQEFKTSHVIGNLFEHPELINQ